MMIEYEATFPDIDKDKIRRALARAGATLARPEFLQKRVTFNPPAGYNRSGAWLRVRDEGDKITLTYKVVDGDKIHNQKELTLKIDDFATAVKLLNAIGCEEKSYQETKRELWLLDGAEIALDEWPFLEPLLEVEGRSEEAVKRTCGTLGLDYSQALFCSITTLYHRKYGVAEDTINNHTPEITFQGKNPFIQS